MKFTFKLEDLDCAHCAAKIEKEIAKLDGVDNVSVSFLAQKITLECDEGAKSDVFAKVKAICKKIEPDCTVFEK